MPKLIFDPFSPEVIADPYPHYDRLRTCEPAFKTPFGAWFLTRYEDVAFVLRDRRFGKDFERGRGAQMSQEPILQAMSKMLIYLDPPDHTRIRGLVAHGFSVKRVKAMRPRVCEIAEGLIQQAAVSSNGMDLVRDFAFPLSLTVIAELLGIPEEDRSLFFGRLPVLGRAIDAPPMTRRDLDEANARVDYLEDYFLKLLDYRRREPGDDLVTDLLQARDAEDMLTDEELLSNIMLLFGAGHETTANLIGNSIIALYQHPQELAKVKENVSAIADGIDELIRYGASVQFGGRTAMENVEVCGKLISKGDIVLASLGAANRDPAVFKDPHRLDLNRKNVREQAFGGGIHFCLGAQLARMEIEVALTTLFSALSGLELEDLNNLRWKPSFIFRGPQSLPAKWNRGS